MIALDRRISKKKCSRFLCRFSIIDFAIKSVIFSFYFSFTNVASPPFHKKGQAPPPPDWIRSMVLNQFWVETILRGCSGLGNFQFFSGSVQKRLPWNTRKPKVWWRNGTEIFRWGCGVLYKHCHSKFIQLLRKEQILSDKK